MAHLRNLCGIVPKMTFLSLNLLMAISVVHLCFIISNNKLKMHDVSLKKKPQYVEFNVLEGDKQISLYYEWPRNDGRQRMLKATFTHEVMDFLKKSFTMLL
eukprot:36836_1